MEAGLTVSTDKDGFENVVTVVKGTFNIQQDGKCILSKVQKPLVYEDECYGEPGLSSVRYESDFAMYKHKTDIIVKGTAHAQRGKAVRTVDVNLQIAEINKTIRVFGDRVWEKSPLGGYRPSKPKPFKSMPLLYERAFGGADTSHKDKKKHRDRPGK